MEVDVIALIKNKSVRSNSFIYKMFADGDDRPLFEDEIDDANEKVWFALLDELNTPEECIRIKKKFILAYWFLNSGWEADVLELLNSLNSYPVKDVHLIAKGDDGWLALYIMKNGEITKHEAWKKRSIEKLLEASSSDLEFLKKIRKNKF